MLRKKIPLIVLPVLSLFLPCCSDSKKSIGGVQEEELIATNAVVK